MAPSHIYRWSQEQPWRHRSHWSISKLPPPAASEQDSSDKPRDSPYLTTTGMLGETFQVTEVALFCSRIVASIPKYWVVLLCLLQQKGNTSPCWKIWFGEKITILKGRIVSIYVRLYERISLANQNFKSAYICCQVNKSMPELMIINNIFLKISAPKK